METILDSGVRQRVVPDLAELSVDDLWSWLGEEDRLAACRAFWSCDDTTLARERQRVLKDLATHLHFRLKTLQNASSDKLGEHLMKCSSGFRQHRDSFIRAWLLTSRRELICDFLGGAKLEHQEGIVGGSVPEPDGDQLTAGIGAVGADDPRGLRIYFGYLLVCGGVFWAALPAALGRSGFQMQDELPAQGSSDEGEEEEVVGEVPEQSDEFTTLDNTLIRLAVASAFGEEGALDHEQLSDLVDEVVELNSQRQHSLFHRGFLHALLSQSFEFSFPGENKARRRWYFCGVLFGLLRHDERDRCLALLRKESDLAQDLADGRDTRCGVMLLPHLLSLLLDGEEHDLLGRWIGSQLEHASIDFQRQVLTNLYYRASTQLRRGNAAEAGLLLEWVSREMEKLEEVDGEGRSDAFMEVLAPQVIRKTAQVAQLEGDFERAKALFERVARSGGLANWESANAFCDLGLIEGGFRSLVGCLPAPSGEDSEAIREALVKGRPMFEEAVVEHGTAAVNAHFVLGLLATLEPTGDTPDMAQQRADHFRQAMAGMMRKRAKYDAVGLLDWTRFGLALALLETLNRSELLPAGNDLQHALASSVHFPMTLWSRALTALAAFETDDIATSVARALLEKRSSEALPSLEESGLAVADARTRAACFEWLDTGKLPPSELWGRLEGLLPGSLQDGDMEQAEEILDRLEALAMRHPDLRARFVRLLDDADRWSPAWDQEDADYVRVRLLEFDGHFLSAVQILRSHFLRIRDDGRSHRVKEALEIVERVARYQLDEDPAAELRALLIEEEPDEYCETVRDQLRGGEKVRVLYVGGNETQEAYEEKIRSRLKSDYPGMEVDFEFPGWGSNWNKPLKRIVDHLFRYDCIVLHRYVRTRFGRKLRAECSADCPWLPCTGTGRDSLERAIVDAACFALRKGKG